MRGDVEAGSFPAHVVFGAATAAYQIEGAVAQDGREPSIWDTFCAVPQAVRGGDTGAVACDHYHRYAADVDLLATMGVDAYRFSLAWPRVLPHGRVNPAGLGFYDRLVDALLAAGVEPWVTLYHWDLPQQREDEGGWPARATAYRFAEFAELAAERFGDRVRHWITVNEPWCAAFLGYAAGAHAPGRNEPGAAMAAAHHLLLGHGLATQAIRSARAGSQVGITLNLCPVTPVDDRPAHLDAARRLDGLSNRLFLDALLRGRYPQDVLADVAHLVDPGDYVAPGDLDVISAPADFLGVNYYYPTVVEAGAFPGSMHVAVVDGGRPRTAMDWEIDAGSLTTLLLRLHREYRPPPLVITENGSAWDDVVDADGAVHDPDRLAYLRDHLAAVAAAIDAGVDVRGYFAWSLLDNFEWAWGYAKRFGLVYVDYPTQRRILKDSGIWYAAFLAERARTGGARADGARTGSARTGSAR